MNDTKIDDETLAMLTVISKLSDGKHTVSYLSNLYETTLRKIQQDHISQEKPKDHRFSQR